MWALHFFSAFCMVTVFVCLLRAQDIALTYVPLGPKEQPLVTATWAHAGLTCRASGQDDVCWDDPLPQDARASQALLENRKLVKEIVIEIWSAPVAVVFEGWDGCVSTQDEGVHIAVYDKTDDGPHAVALGRNLNKIYHGVVLNFDFQNWNPRDWCKRVTRTEKNVLDQLRFMSSGMSLGWRMSKIAMIAQKILIAVTIKRALS